MKIASPVEAADLLIVNLPYMKIPWRVRAVSPLIAVHPYMAVLRRVVGKGDKKGILPLNENRPTTYTRNLESNVERVTIPGFVFR